MLHLAIYHPEIPPNTGNLGRLCVGMGAHLHLIGPCAFDLSDKALRRAGLDYWPHLSWTFHHNDDAFLAWLDDRPVHLITKFGAHRFDQAPYADDDVIIMGNELKGLPTTWHQRWPERGVMIPIIGEVRSYNVANAAAIVLAHASLKVNPAFAAAAPHRRT